MSTSQPERRSNSPARRPLMEPPTTRARCLRVWLDPAISCRQKLLYIGTTLEDRHVPDNAGQAARNVGSLGLAAGDPGGVRARAEEPQSLRRQRAGVGDGKGAGLDHPPQA